MINLFLAASELMNENDGAAECPIFVRCSTVAPRPLTIQHPRPRLPPGHPDVSWTDSTVLLQEFLQVLPKILPDLGPSPDSEPGQKVAVFSYN